MPLTVIVNTIAECLRTDYNILRDDKKNIRNSDHTLFVSFKNRQKYTFEMHAGMQIGVNETVSLKLSDLHGN
jgi:hypothetical protein